MPVEIRLEQLSANDPTARITEWLVEDGAAVAVGDAIAAVETAKVSVDVVSPHAGIVVRSAAVADVIGVGDLLAYVCADQAEVDAMVRDRAEPVEPEARTGRYSAAAARYMTEHGIPDSAFADYDLVTLADAQEVHGRLTRPTATKSLEVARLTEANVLNASLSVQFAGERIRADADTADLPTVRLLGRVVAATARALADFPQLNGYYDDGVRLRSTIDIGVAIDLGDGLKVGVVRQDEPVEDRLMELVSRYVDGTLTPADVAESSLTISDLSMENVLFFQPLLNHRQALALGVGGDLELPGQPLTLTATFDHRVTSGREVSAFLATIRRHLAVGGTS
ncbi:2-oxo acid dehydrogenase subunit E2 [Kutzneria kofuensis]|uniref:Dihydrolipoamide acetyltransferase component of pyruvate dehydrogenase complex n=1 Tax=Kutzneria kofuensis TaxID=103725 RepID=A0A7W9NKT5_9PSEU|nr:2-oxo acid dehydrogenase subunit E2 [Kutzneria kofuensis]MBB5896360.1 pyruvate/2-oxoglutarate dehydrogenase complex dihydrolipoamide acyltransferase (E2) component [Kutzneria kofuensis]